MKGGVGGCRILPLLGAGSILMTVMHSFSHQRADLAAPWAEACCLTCDGGGGDSMRSVAAQRMIWCQLLLLRQGGVGPLGAAAVVASMVGLAVRTMGWQWRPHLGHGAGTPQHRPPWGRARRRGVRHWWQGSTLRTFIYGSRCG
jgi:hypothetical protein